VSFDAGNEQGGQNPVQQWFTSIRVQVIKAKGESHFYGLWKITAKYSFPCWVFRAKSISEALCPLQKAFPLNPGWPPLPIFRCQALPVLPVQPLPRKAFSFSGDPPGHPEPPAFPVHPEKAFIGFETESSVKLVFNGCKMILEI
jgi:hypothetical protein